MSESSPRPEDAERLPSAKSTADDFKDLKFYEFGVPTVFQWIEFATLAAFIQYVGVKTSLPLVTTVGRLLTTLLVFHVAVRLGRRPAQMFHVQSNRWRKAIVLGVLVATMFLADAGFRKLIDAIVKAQIGQ